MAIDITGRGIAVYPFIKVPDTLPDVGRIIDVIDEGTEWEWTKDFPYIYGGNDVIPMFAQYAGESPYVTLAVRKPNGTWPMALWENDYQSFDSLDPDGIYGSYECHPVVGDFDGDGTDDRAVLCPEGWTISFSDGLFKEQRDPDGARRIPLGYDPKKFTLPGKSYVGGISYQKVLQWIAFQQQMAPGVPPVIPVDMPGPNFGN